MQFPGFIVGDLHDFSGFQGFRSSRLFGVVMISVEEDGVDRTWLNFIRPPPWLGGGEVIAYADDPWPVSELRQSVVGSVHVLCMNLVASCLELGHDILLGLAFFIRGEIGRVFKEEGFRLGENYAINGGLVKPCSLIVIAKSVSSR